MDIILSNVIEVLPESFHDQFIDFISKMEDICMAPQDIINLIRIISTNQHVYKYIQNTDNTSIQQLQTAIFKEVRSNLDHNLCIQIGPIIHVIIHQYLKLIKNNSSIHQFLKQRHDHISALALIIKQKQPELNDFDAWIAAEKELFIM